MGKVEGLAGGVLLGRLLRGARPAPSRGLEGLLGTDTSRGATTQTASADTAQADTAQAGGGAISNLIQQGAIPGEYFVRDQDVTAMRRYLSDSAIRTAMPPGKELLWGSDSTVIAGGLYRSLYMVDARPIITGEYLTDARPNTSPLEGTIVQFTLNNVGGRRFRIDQAIVWNLRGPAGGCPGLHWRRSCRTLGGSGHGGMPLGMRSSRTDRSPRAAV